jgi:hypothetical protein
MDSGDRARADLPEVWRGTFDGQRGLVGAHDQPTTAADYIGSIGKLRGRRALESAGSILPSAPKRRNSHDFYFADDVSVRSDYQARTTSAPLGRTPNGHHHRRPVVDHMISAVMVSGSFNTTLCRTHWTWRYSPTSVTQTARRHACSVVIIVYGHPVNRPPCKRPLPYRQQAAAVSPASYLPELTPVNGYGESQNDSVGRPATTSFDDFTVAVITA